jgi:hypothetical protein
MYYLYRRLRINDLVPSPDDGATAIKHGDLNAWNVIVNNKGLSGCAAIALINIALLTIYSIVDWDTSRLSPAPSAIQHPLFIADVPGWLNDDVPEGMTFEEDRAYLESAIGKLDINSKDPGRIEYLLRTSFERQFMELSLHNRKINKEYIKKRLGVAKPDKKKVLEQLEDFLKRNDDMRDVDSVLDLQNRLAKGS